MTRLPWRAAVTISGSTCSAALSNPRIVLSGPFSLRGRSGTALLLTPWMSGQVPVKMDACPTAVLLGYAGCIPSERKPAAAIRASPGSFPASTMSRMTQFGAPSHEMMTTLDVSRGVAAMLDAAMATQSAKGMTIPTLKHRWLICKLNTLQPDARVAFEARVKTDENPRRACVICCEWNPFAWS